jgi:hypothetical protein
MSHDDVFKTPEGLAALLDIEEAVRAALTELKLGRHLILAAST